MMQQSLGFIGHVESGDSAIREWYYRPPIAVELFSGAGGMSLGFEAAGFDTLIAVDNNPIHAATHEWNFPRTLSFCEDIELVRADLLLSKAESEWRKREYEWAWPGDIDCLFGGPSCQGFSEIGKHNPSDSRNSLLIRFAQIVRDIRPKYFVMENVPGLLASANSKVLGDTLDIFDNADYKLASGGPLVLRAADFGVPQARRRVFLIGARSDQLVPSMPSAPMTKVTVSQALDDLRLLERCRTLSCRDAIQLSAAQVADMESRGSTYVQFLRDGLDRRHGSLGLGHNRPWDRASMTSSGRTVHRIDVVERFRRTAPGSEEAISRLPRLRADGLAPTLRAGTGRDHGSFTSARPIHHIYPRVITVREAARLNSFPDWFRFHVTKWHGFQQVGNSVPPLLGKAVAETIVDALGLLPTKPTAPLELRDDGLLQYSLVQAASYYGIDAKRLPKDSRLRNSKTSTGAT